MNLSRDIWAKLPLSLIVAWTIFLLIVYFFMVQQAPQVGSSSEYQHGMRSSHALDGIVYIVMGSLAANPIVDYSIASVRKIGQWNGRIFVITDQPACFNSTMAKYDINIIKAPPVQSLIEIKAMKTKLFHFLPSGISGILYLDVDIVVRQSFESFYNDLRDILSKRLPFLYDSPSNSSSSVRKANETSYHFDMTAFPDSKGHFVGFCSGCEKWHTGVLFMRRNFGQNCLSGWEKILLSGKYDTDQESLDEAERLGYCPNLVMMPPKHLLFAKDYIGMMLTSGQTFIHFTSAVRMDTQDYFYKKLVVPNLRRSLNPPLRSSLLAGEKYCLVKRTNITRNITM